ncbi:MAG TPA: hypothetical protein VHX65_10175 [Pirellulales bacterium]|jgi:hypothetical protein|nr:hypothetical protein [Pirellulales bacterium]
MRKLFFTALCVLAASAGCRQCASPYDYCSPVVENGPEPSLASDSATYEPDYASNRGGGNSQAAGMNAGSRMATAPQPSSQGSMQ